MCHVFSKHNIPEGMSFEEYKKIIEKDMLENPEKYSTKYEPIDIYKIRGININNYETPEFEGVISSGAMWLLSDEQVIPTNRPIKAHVKFKSTEKNQNC